MARSAGEVRVLLHGGGSAWHITSLAAAFQHRHVFGAAREKVNLQIHTHDKYKKVHPQPKYR
jgi:hypothetical protein